MAKAYRYSRETGKMEPFSYPEPKRLSKFGRLMEQHPNGMFKIIDMKAVLQ